MQGILPDCCHIDFRTADMWQPSADTLAFR